MIPPYLENAYLAGAAEFAELPQEATAAVLAAAASVRTSAELVATMREAHECMFREQELDEKFALEVPALGEHSGMLPVLVLLSGLPRARAFWKSRGVPDEVAVQTLSDIGIWMRHHRARTGRWGLSELGWLQYHLTGKVYRLGRVQFLVGKHWGEVHAFRHRSSGEVRLFTQAGRQFRADGQFDGANHIRDPEGSWTSQFETNGHVIRGNPIAPDGHAVRQVIELRAVDWEETLRPDDSVLDMHIPAEGPLLPDAVRESVRRALAFFPAHFPDRPFKAVVCYGWLLDPTLQKILPPTANLPGFQSLFHLFPIWENEDHAFERVFGGTPADLASAPRDTDIRRAILDLYASGGRLIGGAGGLWRDT
jgi:hypothetical protein